ncbi:MAG: hypothetical protein F6K11_28585, partial [Leptolyngbya sp. SIO3F4]|nr:hypothetical protein [Leptolyngbya sp. SIO3F4]
KRVNIEAAERLLEAGIDHTNLGFYADEFGASGIQAIDNLVQSGGTVRTAIHTIELAQGISEAQLVIDLVNSGKLSNLRGLRNFLREVAQELSQGQTGKYDQLREVARRASEGHDVSLEGRAKMPDDPESGQADIVDHTSREAIQMKTVRSGATDLRTAGDALTRNVQSAIDQLGGAGGEIPPSGYRLIAWVRILVKDNPFSRMTRAEILDNLQGQLDNLNTLSPPDTPVGEVRVTNNRGTFSYSPVELR